MPKKEKKVESAEDAVLISKIMEAFQAACSHTAYSPLDDEVHYKKILEKFNKLAMSQSAGPIELLQVALDIALHKRWHQLEEPKHVFDSMFCEATNRDIAKCNICGRMFVDYQTLEDVTISAEQKIAQIALMKGYPLKSESEHHCGCHHEK